MVDSSVLQHGPCLYIKLKKKLSLLVSNISMAFPDANAILSASYLHSINPLDNPIR